MLKIASTQWDFNLNGIELKSLDPESYFIFFLWIVWIIVSMIGLVVFIYRRNDLNIKQRSPTLVISSTVGAAISFTCTVFSIATKQEGFPCFLDLWYILIFLPLYIFPFVLRFGRYYGTMILLKRWQEGKIANLKSSIWVNEGPWVVILGIAISICMGVACLIQYALIPEWVNTYGCQLTDITFIFLIIILCIVLLIVGAGFFLMRGIEDQYHLKSELVTCFAIWMLTLFPYLIIYRVSPERKIALALLMYAFIATGYFTSVMWPIYLSFKRPPETNAPEKPLDTIEQIVEDKEGYEIFMKVAQIRQATEMPPLLKAIIHFRQISDPEELKRQSTFIFNQYIKAGAPQQNNFPANMVQEIQERLENPTSDLFNGPHRELVKLVKTNFLREIQNRDDYLNLVKKREEERKNAKLQDDILQGRNDDY